MTSASRAIGGLEPWACSTSLTICARAVSLPTFVAVKVNDPVVLRVAPMTSSPAPLLTGIGSPVSMDSSTADEPSATTPSTGIFSPERTRTRSPGTTSAIGTSTSRPSRTTRAVLGWRPISLRTASPVWPLARASSILPNRIRVMIERRRVEVERLAEAGVLERLREEHAGDAVEVGRRRAHRDERVHVHAEAVAQAGPRARVELPRRPRTGRAWRAPTAGSRCAASPAGT